jgi:hypothetical protein
MDLFKIHCPAQSIRRVWNQPPTYLPRAPAVQGVLHHFMGACARAAAAVAVYGRYE